MLHYFETLQDESGNALSLDGTATVAVTAYPGGGAIPIYSTNSTSSPILASTVIADITGQVSFYAPDGAYILTYSLNGTPYKIKTPVQMTDPLSFVAFADSGAANAYVVTDQRLSTALYDGLKIEIQVGHSNSGGSTLNVNATGAQAIVLSGGSALPAGALLTKGRYRLEWDAANNYWQLIGSFFPPNFAQTQAEINALVTPVNFTLPPGQIDRYFNNVSPGVTDAAAGFAAAILQAQQVAGGIAIGNPLTQNSNLAVGSNVTIPSAGGSPVGTVPMVPFSVISGQTVIAAGKTLTINGSFAAPRQTVFSGAGAVILARGSCKEAYPEWWGARADSAPGVGGTISVTGTDCTAAIDAALIACAGGAGLLAGLVPLSFAAGNYLTANQTYPPATCLRGVGREQCSFLAKAGTTGTWLTDTGSAAKIILEDLAFYGAYTASPAMTNNTVLGYNGTQFGTEGYIKSCWFRDAACAGGGYQLDVSQNVGFFDQLSIYSNGLAGQSCCRISGSIAHMSKIVCLGAGSGGYGLNLPAISSIVTGLEIEAPQGGSIPLFLAGNAVIDGVSFSHGSYAAVGPLDAWVVFGPNCTTWKLTGVNYLFSAAAANSGTDTVTSGNFQRADGSYFGGNATANSVYNAATTYNQGNVTNSSGVSYIYINGTPTAGNAPPNATYWAVTTLPYGHGAEGNYFSDNYGQIDQSFTFRLVNTAGTLQHRFSDPFGNVLNPSLISSINAATQALTNTPTGTDASTAFAAGAKISTAQSNAVILDTPGWPAGVSESTVHTQRVGDYDCAVSLNFNTSTTALTCIAAVQSFTVNGITRNRWTLGFYDAASGVAFALNTTNIAAGKLVQVSCRIAMAR